MSERNVELESAIYSGLLVLSEIPIEPKIEDASGVIVIYDSNQLNRLQDRIQEVAPAFEVSSEDVVNPSIELVGIQPQPDINPSHLEKETHYPEISTSNPMDVQERIRPDWMNTPASSSHLSPGGHPDIASTPASS
ncbi:hypothetical protein Nepgr_004829 [Nepenthes gracilis]|uniref:Uncharacterized protein n=1 Tax=Nepenthes gracilis TaxID=150966 RepID=A0AAD3S236_NEPGR|nr:hypothetical protein Nepgr_004829 [Nepenthes gracilis]